MRIKQIIIFAAVLMIGTGILTFSACQKEDGDNNVNTVTSVRTASAVQSATRTASGSTSIKTTAAAALSTTAAGSTLNSSTGDSSDNNNLNGNTATETETQANSTEKEVGITDDNIQIEAEDALGEALIDLKGRIITCGGWDNFVLPVYDATLVNAQREVWIKKMEAAQEKYNFKLQVTKMASSTVFNKELVTNTLAGIKYFDVFYTQSQMAFPAFVNQNLIIPLDEYIDYNLPIIKVNTVMNQGTLWKGKHYGVTQYVSVMGLMIGCNAELIGREGQPEVLDLAENNLWTWEAMLSIAKNCTRDINGDGILDQYGLTGYNVSNWNFILTMLNSNGVIPIDLSSGRPVFSLDSPPAMRALQFVADLTFVHKVFISNSPKLYDQGMIAMAIVSGGGNRAPVKAGIVSRLLPLPKGPDVDRYQNTGTSQFFAISSLSENPGDVARVFTEGSILWTEEGVDIPEVAEVSLKYFPADWPWSTSNTTRYYTTERELLLRVEAGKTLRTDFTKGFPGVETYLNTYLATPLFKGEKSASQAVESVKSAIQDIFDANY